MTRLEEVATAVHALLDEGAVEPNEIGIAHDAVALQQHQKQRRIVWLTTGGAIEPPRQAGGRVPSDGTAARVRLCKVRVERVEAHIFAETRELTEILLDNVIAALTHVLELVEMPSYDWETEVTERAGKVLRSQHCVLHFLLRLPVPDQIRELRTVAGIEDVCGTLAEDGSITAQP